MMMRRRMKMIELVPILVDQFNTFDTWKTVIMYFAKNILFIICSSPPGQVCRGATLSVRTNKKTIKFVFFVCFFPDNCDFSLVRGGLQWLDWKVMQPRMQWVLVQRCTLLLVQRGEKFHQICVKSFSPPANCNIRISRHNTWLHLFTGFAQESVETKEKRIILKVFRPGVAEVCK